MLDKLMDKSLMNYTFMNYTDIVITTFFMCMYLFIPNEDPECGGVSDETNGEHENENDAERLVKDWWENI